MTALIVIAAVILFFALILNIKVRAEIRYMGGKLDIKVKYFLFTVYPIKKRRRKKPKKVRAKKAKKSASAQKSSSDKTESADISEKNTETAENGAVPEEEVPKKKSRKEKAEKEKLSDKIDKLALLIERVKIIWSFSGKHLRNLFTHIYLEKLFIDFVIAGEDAYKTAVSYGTVNAAVYNVIAVLQMMFTLKVKTVDILCDFDRKEPVYDCGLNITLRPSTALSVAFGLLFGFLKNYSKIMGKSQPESKTAVQA